MSKNNKYSLFFNNKYIAQNDRFYRTRMRGSITVAVDGGIRFFLRNKICPDILIGDFDSAPRLSRKYLSKIETVRFSPEKDKTDGHLALELVLDRGADRIEIFGAISIDEIDHTLGNILLLELINKFNRAARHRVSASIISPDTEIRLLENDIAKFGGRKDDYISVIPLSDIVRAKYKGLLYPAPKEGLRLGDSLSLRNRLTEKTCQIKISGKAIIVLNRGL